MGCSPNLAPKRLESGLALVEVLFRYFAHPVHAVVCCLHSSFGILLSEIRWIFGHSSASLNPGWTAFAAWLGLVPRQNSTGGKARLGGISKRGDSYLRRLLVNSAHTVLLCSKAAKTDPWLTSLLSRKPRLVVAVALANKTARMAWAIMSRPDLYRHATSRSMTS